MHLNCTCSIDKFSNCLDFPEMLFQPLQAFWAFYVSHWSVSRIVQLNRSRIWICEPKKQLRYLWYNLGLRTQNIVTKYLIEIKEAIALELKWNWSVRSSLTLNLVRTNIFTSLPNTALAKANNKNLCNNSWFHPHWFLRRLRCFINYTNYLP